ncbi:MAG TPA: enolase C-terminal domain-like protein, partial [Puia sp.]
MERIWKEGGLADWSAVEAVPGNARAMGKAASLLPAGGAEYKYGFFEEPVQYDWLERTKQVKDAVSIPIAGGEQQHGIEEFRWYMAHDGLDVVQPDQYYFGGMLRSTKVARMAELMGKECTPHLTDGFGFIYMMHFMSTVPNAGAHIEFKGYAKIPIE